MSRFVRILAPSTVVIALLLLVTGSEPVAAQVAGKCAPGYGTQDTATLEAKLEAHSAIQVSKALVAAERRSRVGNSTGLQVYKSTGLDVVFAYDNALPVQCRAQGLRPVGQHPTLRANGRSPRRSPRFGRTDAVPPRSEPMIN